MILVNPGQPFSFHYPTFDFNNSLFVRASIYDVSSGSPSLVTMVNLSAIANGYYFGSYTGLSAKTYLVICAVYTDGTYATLDTTRAPGSSIFTMKDAPISFCAFEMGLFDQSTQFVAANVYECSTGTPILRSQVVMSWVLAGVYFGSFTGALLKNYEVQKNVYTSSAYTTIDTDYAPGSESFILFPTSVVQLSGGVLGGQVVSFTQGDDQISLSFRLQDGNGNPINLTGATFSTEILGPQGVMVVIPNSQHSIVSAVNGQFSFTMSAAQTSACLSGSGKEIVTQAVIGGVTMSFHGKGILTVLGPNPIQ